MKHIHVASIGPRSGTTLLAELLHSCFEIDSYCGHEARLYSEPPQRVNVYLTKYPSILDVGIPLRMRRSFFVVCILRDPRDTCVSKHGSDPNRYWGGLKYWKKELPVWRKLKAHPRFLTIKYEDLVTHPDHAQQLIMSQLPFLTKRADFSSYHKVASQVDERSLKAMRGIREIERSSVGRWRDHLPRVKSQIGLHGPIHAELIEVEYENDSEWLGLLRSVQPDASPSNRPEFFDRTVMLRNRIAGVRSVIVYALRSLGVSPLGIKRFIKHAIMRRHL